GHLPASSSRVARITASEPDRATANTAGQRLPDGHYARQADELRREHVRLQESSVRLLPYAICGIQRTDPVGQSDDGRVSRLVRVPRRQTDRAAIHVFPLVPGTPVQRNTTTVLWRKLLGLTGHWIFDPES